MQTVLLLAILIVPSLAIIPLGLNDFRREDEKRLKDVEEHTRIEVHQELLQAFERIKLEEISGADSHQAVMLVAAVKDDRRELPWDLDPNTLRFRESVEEASCSRTILQAKRVEGAEKRYEQAAALYRESIATARSERQRVYARFLLAGTLARSGRESDASPIHQDRSNGVVRR